MEDVLNLCTQPRDPQRPLVCLDETSKQLIGETRHMFFAPLVGWRHVKVTDRRTKADWADCMRDLVDVHFPGALLIRVVQDNLNTHDPSAPAYAGVFEPAEARRILDRLEFHYTPKHGSWLNMAEIELSVLDRQCLDRRIPDKSTLVTEVLAWEQPRNTRGATVDWRFTTDDARIKLKKLYPSVLC
jgi:hypothetical protein